MLEVHTLVSGLVVGESPRWHEGRLWFSHWGAQEVLAVDSDGTCEVMTHVPTAVPFCIDWLPDGRLLIVSGQERLLLRREPDGSLVPHADLSSLSDYPWNEIVVDGRGNIYVNTIGFDFPTGTFAPGLLAVVTPDGAVRQVADGVAFPNGIVVTPDNATLIVAESYGHRLTAFDIAADGSLGHRRVWADLGDGAPDGAVWYADVPHNGACACAKAVWWPRRSRWIALFRGMLGGADRRALFLLAADWRGAAQMAEGAHGGQVLTAAAPAPGVGWP